MDITKVLVASDLEANLSSRRSPDAPTLLRRCDTHLDTLLKRLELWPAHVLVHLLVVLANARAVRDGLGVST
jgi:hypothetical protein